ncbi:MAG: serine/threonine-protein kinase [Methylococcales bacterium]|nr:serine/threonine-protein kinase [Methylococcales bacterium]
MIDENRYEIREKLGQGAMGTVYKAIDKQIDREVAIKLLHPHLLAGEMGDEFSKRFEQEVKAAARCQHPNVVTVYDFGIHEDSPYMIMEYVKGVDLQAFLKSGQRFSAEQAINVILKVLDALLATHALGVVHRDIKPANIMLLENGQIKVMDFGVARLDTSELTQWGDVMGTPCYMSPEAHNGESANSLSDLYTTALVLLELLIRKRLNSAIIDHATIVLELEKQHLAPNLLTNLALVLTKALQKNPALRYQNALVFSKELAGCLEVAPNYYQLAEDLVATVVRVKTQLKGNQSPPDKIPATLLNNDSVLLQSQLGEVEKSLTCYLGPIAKMLVKKHAQQSTNVEQFLGSLVDYIPSEIERQTFMHNLQVSGVYTSARSGCNSASVISTASSEKSTLSVEFLEQLTADLTYYLGPVAKHLVTAAHKKSTSQKELCASLAEKIPDSNERTRFLTTWSKK